MICYVPAGVESYSGSTAQLYVKHSPNKKESTEFGKKYKKWCSLDRTVIETVSSGRGVVLPDDSFDVAIPMFSPTFIKSCGLRLILANPEVGKGFKKAPYEKAGIKSIVDSGGFQLLRANVDFIHPDTIVERYNNEANIGMPLDLPVRAYLEDAYFNKASHLIRANDNYILPRLKEGVELALISHGTSLERRISRLNVLDRKANIVAIAGLGIAPPPGVDRVVAAVENLMYVVSRYHKTAKYFHVLGVTSRLWIFIYSLLERSGYVKNIGADSVSHRLGALTGMVETIDFKSFTIDKNLKVKTLPICNCPICTSVDDLRIIQASRLLESHNLWVKAKQTEIIGDLAEAYLKGEISLSDILRMMNLKIESRRFTNIVNYIQNVMASKFIRFRKVSSTKQLFSVKQAPSSNDHYEAVIRRYEEFHGTKFKNT